MRFRQIPLQCRQCGEQVPARIKQVGLTPQHELVIHFVCLKCRRRIYIVKSLADCWRECPPSGNESEPVEPMPMQEPDLEFLHSLGVAYPEDDQ